jgi:O-antigen/teichoic acid export membrane protein
MKTILGICLLIPVTTFYLNPEDFGALAIISAVTGSVLPLTSSGAIWVLGSNYFSLRETERKELAFTVLLLDVVLRLVLVAVLWLASDTLLPLIIKESKPEYVLFFKIHLLSLLCCVFWPTVSYLLILENRARLHASMEIGQTLIAVLVTTLLLCIFEQKGITLFWAPLATNFCSMLVELALMCRLVRARLDTRWLKEIWTVGAPSILANTAEAISNSADRFFIQKWDTLNALGIYSHSHTYGTMLKTINKSFARTINPSALKAFSTGADTYALKFQIRAWYAIVFSAGTLVVLFSREFLDILTHGKFIEAAPLVAVWVYLMLSHTLGLSSGQYLLSRQATKTLHIVQMTVSLIFIGIIGISTYCFGVLGAAISVLLSNLSVQLAYIYRARQLGNPYRDHLSILAPASFLALLIAVHNLLDVPIELRLAEACFLLGASLRYARASLRRLKHVSM